MIMPEGPAPAVIAVAKEAERLGFRRLWIPDEGLAARECWVLLGAIAQATTNIGIGTGITNAYTRHPGVTAAAAATLDELSGGRAALGIGAGGTLTLGPLAIKRDAPLRAVRDLITASRALWADESLAADGPIDGFSDARLEYGRPDIPVWIAGRGPKITQLAGEVADGFLLSFVHKEFLGAHVQALRTAAERANRPIPTITYMTMLASNDEALAEAKRGLTFRLVDSPAEVKERVGLTPTDEAAIRRHLSEGGPAAAAHLIRDEWLEGFVIVGDAETCRKELKDLVGKHRFDEFQVPITDLDSASQTLAAAAAVALG